MTNTVTNEYGRIRITDELGDYIFIDPQAPVGSNVVNLLVSDVVTLDREGVVALQEALSGVLAAFDEATRPVPIPEQITALEPGTVFQLNFPSASVSSIWMRTTYGVISQKHTSARPDEYSGWYYNDAELVVLFTP